MSLHLRFWRFSGVLVHLIFHKINFFFLHSLGTNGLLYVNMLLGRLTIGFRCVQRLLLGHTFTNTNWSHSMYAAALFHWIFFLFPLSNVAYHTNKYHTILIRIIAHFCNQFGSSPMQDRYNEASCYGVHFVLVVQNCRIYTHPSCYHYYHYLHSLAYPIT